MVKVGDYNILKVDRAVDFGVYLQDGGEGLLLPRRYIPEGVNIGDDIRVFVYHDSEDRLIATTLTPKAIVGEVAYLEAVMVTQQGAFLDWGLPKDLFVPRSKQLSGMRQGGRYLVRLFIDEQTGRVAATEKIESSLSNDNLTVKLHDPVQLTVYRRTDIGYLCIINNIHTGVLHHNEIYRNIQVGDKFEGFIKAIRDEDKIDLAAGRKGFQRVEDEGDKIMRLLRENDGYLPYYDKSDPDDIYDFFGMSKKTFKMTIGTLYKQRKIELTGTGIRLQED